MFRELKEYLLKIFKVKGIIIIPKECANLLKQIKYYFSYLFDLYGFEVVHGESARTDCAPFKRLSHQVLPHSGRSKPFVRSVIDFIEKKPLNVK